MSVTIRSPLLVRKTRSRMTSPCEVDTVCSGDRLINEHATRVSWWLAGGLVVLALVFVGVIGQHAFKTQATGPWSQLHASSWIQPTPRALAALVGITLVLDIYITYMMALRKGHLDRFVGQFLLSTLIRIGLWLFFLYGLAYGGYIGSMFSAITLAIMVAWGFMTSHSHAPLHSWLSALEFVFVIFLVVWLSTSNAKVWPSA